jgi:hypothetical protein
VTSIGNPVSSPLPSGCVMQSVFPQRLALTQEDRHVLPTTRNMLDSVLPWLLPRITRRARGSHRSSPGHRTAGALLFCREKESPLWQGIAATSCGSTLRRPG